MDPMRVQGGEMIQIEYRLGSLLRSHARQADPEHANYPNCSCGFKIESTAWAGTRAYSEHAAAAIAANLRFEEERAGVRAFDDESPTGRSDTIKRRWVTPWREISRRPEPAPKDCGD